MPHTGPALVALALLTTACGGEPVAARAANEPPAAHPEEPRSFGAAVSEADDAGAPDAVAASNAASPESPPAAWPSDVPWLAGATLRETDELSVNFELPRVESDTQASVAERFAAAARVLGYRTTTRGDGSELTLEREGKKSWAAISGDTSKFRATFGRAKHAPARLAGACIPVPRVEHRVAVESSGINQHGERGEGTVHWRIENWLVDIDGDGELDELVPVAPLRNACPWEVRYGVYVVRGSCGHRLGEVGPGSLVGPVTFDASGFRELRFEAEHAHLGAGSRRGIPVMETRTTVFAVQNGRYRKTRDDVRRGECHHCATSSCRDAT